MAYVQGQSLTGRLSLFIRRLTYVIYFRQHQIMNYLMLGFRVCLFSFLSPKNQIWCILLHIDEFKEKSYDIFRNRSMDEIITSLVDCLEWSGVFNDHQENCLIWG